MRSYFAALRASRLYGRASRMRDDGRLEESLNLARQSLSVLRAPWVARHRPTEGSVLLSTTMLVEQVASKLNQPGAENMDLADALAFLQSLSTDLVRKILGTGQWIPYFEARLEAAERNSNVTRDEPEQS
jgi:hypothetical protein